MARRKRAYFFHRYSWIFCALFLTNAYAMEWFGMLNEVTDDPVRYGLHLPPPLVVCQNGTGYLFATIQPFVSDVNPMKETEPTAVGNVLALHETPRLAVV